MIKILSDIEDVFKASTLADVIYQQELYEPASSFIAKFNVFSEGCLGYFEESVLKGYAFGHPWTKDSIVTIGTDINELPKHPDCYYLHDIAVAESIRGKGIGKSLLMASLLIGELAGFKTITGVSVNNSLKYWQKFGFKEVEYFEYVPNVWAYKICLER